MEQKIECPKCHHKFSLEENISKGIRAELEAEFSKKKNEIEADALKQIKIKLEEVRKEALASAREEAEARNAELHEQLTSQELKLREARTQELELRKQQRELESSKQEFELEMARKLDTERRKIKEEVGTQLAQDHSLKQAEWEKVRTDMMKQIEDLRRKADQGSQQAQGEVLELEVEDSLRESFPHDNLEPVAKGIKGGDILQNVMTRTGIGCGAILWELKRTKCWSDTWIQKLKDDQRSAGAAQAVLVTTVMPKDMKHFGQREGVWIVDFVNALGVASALRSSLIELAQFRQSLVGKQDKMTALYDYLNGSEFRGRIEGIVESFVAMREDLEAERRATERIWAKREKQLGRVMSSTSGMYGDLQGLIGPSLPEIKLLELKHE